MQVETREPALFRSTNAALAFAFNYRHGQYTSSAMGTLMGGPKPTGRGLGGLDGSAQAGMIKAEIDTMTPRIRGQILVARFAVHALPCDCRRACCSGWHPNAEWLRAIDEIADVVRTEALAGCSVNYTLRHAMVQRYFGVSQSLAKVALAADVNRDTASTHARRVIAYLRPEERYARYAIEGRLKAGGIVEEGVLG
jgi:hypothetical protein